MKADAKQIDAKLKEAGYKFLGWQNGWASIMLDENGIETTDHRKYRKHGGYLNQPEYNECIKKGHNDHRNPEHWDSIQHNSRGSENTVSCDVCKIYWKYDCSD